MIKKYNKLVRDKIPEIINKSGKECKIKVLEDEEYLRELNEKLQEELNEYYEDGDVKELADIVEVLYAILDYKGVSFEEFTKIRLEKKEERGGFQNKILLLEVE